MGIGCLQICLHVDSKLKRVGQDVIFIEQSKISKRSPLDCQHVPYRQ
jgi:hypothetical protein